jgi:hypothetical protein
MSPSEPTTKKKKITQITTQLQKLSNNMQVTTPVSKPAIAPRKEMADLMLLVLLMLLLLLVLLPILILLVWRQWLMMMVLCLKMWHSLRTTVPAPIKPRPLRPRIVPLRHRRRLLRVIVHGHADGLLESVWN